MRGTAAAAWRSFRAADYLSLDELKRLHKRSDLAGVVATATTLGLIALALVSVALWPTVPVIVAAIIVLGGRQFALQVLVHEASHRTLFASRRLNDAFGRVFAALYWDDLFRYRATHDNHHRYNASQQDPDVSRFIDYPMSRGALIQRFLRDMLAIDAAFRVIVDVMRDLGFMEYTPSGSVRAYDQRGRSSWDVLRRFMRSLGPTLLVHGVLFAVFALWGHPWAYMCWWAAWWTLFSVFTRLESICAHSCLSDYIDPLRSSRTWYASPIVRLLFGPHRINFHVEHHLLPMVPYFRLPQLHRMLLARGALQGACLAPSWWQVMRLATRTNLADQPGERPTFEAEAARHTAKSAAPTIDSRARHTGLLPRLGAILARTAIRARGLSVEGTP